MAMAEAEAAVESYVSPLGRSIQAIRDRFVANAEGCDWAIDRDSLDDRHIVRRMVLKRCVYHDVVVGRCVGIRRVSRIDDYRHARELGEPIGGGSTWKRVHTVVGSRAVPSDAQSEGRRLGADRGSRLSGHGQQDIRKVSVIPTPRVSTGS